MKSGSLKSHAVSAKALVHHHHQKQRI